MNLALFFAAFRLMTVSSIPTRCAPSWRRPAAAVVGDPAVVGGYYIDHVSRVERDLAEFALVIALLIWLHLARR